MHFFQYQLINVPENVQTSLNTPATPLPAVSGGQQEA